MSTITELLQQGIAAMKSGHTAAARLLLTNVLQIDPQNEQAWLWLSGAVATDAERRFCLEQVLKTNPYNQPAKRGLASLPNIPSVSPLSSAMVSSRTETPQKPGRVQRLPYNGKICAMAISSNDLYQVTNDDNNHLVLWRISDRKKQWTEEDVITNEIAYSPDGSVIAVNETAQITLRDAKNGKLRREINTFAIQMVFSGDGKTMAILNDFEKEIKIINISNGRTIQRIAYQPDFLDESMDYSSNGMFVAAADITSGMLVWHVGRGRLLYNTESACFALRFHPSSRLIAEATLDKINFRRVDDGTIESTIDVHADSSTKIKWSGDGRMMASLDSENILRLWKFPECSPAAILEGRAGKIEDFCLNTQGTMIVVLNEDGTVEYWHLN